MISSIAKQTRYQTLGQSFAIDSYEIGEVISSLTTKMAATTDINFEASGHTLLLAFMHDADGNSSLETQLGQVIEADLSGLNLTAGNYLTISFSKPITLDSSGEYGFILYWQENDTSNILTLERGNGDEYYTGDAIFKNLISAPDTFPVTTTPSGDKDFTFYLD
jgi:hypothetical protein